MMGTSTVGKIGRISDLDTASVGIESSASTLASQGADRAENCQVGPYQAGEERMKLFVVSNGRRSYILANTWIRGPGI